LRVALLRTRRIASLTHTALIKSDSKSGNGKRLCEVGRVWAETMPIMVDGVMTPIKKPRSEQYLIYGLVDPRTSELRYVGKSCQGIYRAQSHTIPSILKKHSGWCGNWLRQLVTEGFYPEILTFEELPNAEETALAEQFFISYFRSLGCRLTNLTDGGEGTPGYRHTEKTRAKQSQIAKNNPRLQEHVRQLSLAKIGTKHTPETLIKMAAASSGRVHSPETRAKISSSNKGKRPSALASQKLAEWNATRPPMSEEAKQRLRELNFCRPKRAIVDQNGVIYESCADACRKLGISPGAVSVVINGKRPSVKGYSFRYVDQTEVAA
jgi:group I intron endonuclease